MAWSPPLGWGVGQCRPAWLAAAMAWHAAAGPRSPPCHAAFCCCMSCLVMSRSAVPCHALRHPPSCPMLQADDGEFVALVNKHTFNLGTLGILLGLLTKLEGAHVGPPWHAKPGVMEAAVGGCHECFGRRFHLRLLCATFPVLQSCPSRTATTCLPRDHRSARSPCCGARMGRVLPLMAPSLRCPYCLGPCPLHGCDAGDSAGAQQLAAPHCCMPPAGPCAR